MNDGPGIADRFGLGVLRGMDRIAREDEATRVRLCLQCGIDPDKVRPPRPLLIASPGAQSRRNPTRRADTRTP